MTIFNGNRKIGNIYHGSRKIGKVFKGTELIYGGEPEPGGWYDTLGFTEFIADNVGGVETNVVQYTEQEMLNILPFYAKWNGTYTNIETGEPEEQESVNKKISINDVDIEIPHDNHEIIVTSVHLPSLSDEGFYKFRLKVRPSSVTATILVDGYIEIRENDANGVVLGHYPVHATLKLPCYLTSAMVGYYGIDDDGIELAAMRRLREVYAEKHAETLKTYYEDSAIIISEIERLGMQDYYYGHIKDVVDEIVIHVENESWNTAEVLYLDLYYGLKEELEILKDMEEEEEKIPDYDL